MARKLKCQWCGNKSLRDEMEQVTTGNKTKVNKYYHKDGCYEAFLAEEEFKAKEAMQKDSLYQTVMEIYDVKALPNTYYMQIEGLRHGNRVFKRQNMTKRYREGYEYDLIEETYEYSRDAIEWSLNNKAFTNLSNALNYGLSIIVNNIYDVERRRESRMEKEHMEEVAMKQKTKEDLFGGFQSSYKKKDKEEDDILLDILDD